MMNVTKLTEVHIHDASNYVRETLDTPNVKASTVVGVGGFRIAVRYAGTLNGFTVEVPLRKTDGMGMGNGTVSVYDLTEAVQALLDWTNAEFDARKKAATQAISQIVAQRNI